MSKYETYKRTDVEWVDTVPEHWQVTKLKLLGNFTSSGIDKLILEDEGSVKMVNYMDVYGNKDSIINSSFDFMVVTCPDSKKEVHNVIKGDLIFTPSSETIEDIGLSALIDEDLDNTVYSYHVLRFRFAKKLEHKFKKYLCNNFYVLSQFSSNAKGTTRQILSREEFKNTVVFIPTPAEQLTIANYLDHQTQKIDRLIANKKAQADKLKELRQIEINNAVTKGLNPNAEMKDSGIDWLGKIPKNWETDRLKNVTYINQEVITEKTSPDYELKYIDIGNVTSNGEFLELQEMTFSEAPSRARRKPKHNSIILSTVRTYLRAIAFVQNPDDNLIASTGFAVIDAYENLFDAKYLFYQMTSHIVVERVIANSDGVSYPAISSTKLGDMKIILPPKVEQELISNYLEDRTTAIDKLIKNIEAQIEKLQEVRKIKIYEAVTGKIKVNAYVEATA